jgi:shikimate kinase
MRSVYLVGFMGSGKSSVGRELARKLGLAFIDLDAVIAEDAGLTIPEIFARDGETVFRLAEREALRWTTGLGPTVVATGGGAFCSPDNRRLIHGSGALSVFLDPPWEVILRRLPGTNDDRPLFESPQSARRLFEEREPDYRKASLTLSVGGDESPAAVATRITEALSEVACAT